MRQITLRLATVADRALLLALFAVDRSASLEPLGLSSVHRNALLETRLRERTIAYARRFPGAAEWIVRAGGRPIGHILLHENPLHEAAQPIRILEFAITPAERKRGYGTAALALVLQRATQQGRDVSLRVRTGSAAVKLYERLGFVQTADEGDHLQMRWDSTQNRHA